MIGLKSSLIKAGCDMKPECISQPLCERGQRAAAVFFFWFFFSKTPVFEVWWECHISKLVKNGCDMNRIEIGINNTSQPFWLSGHWRILKLDRWRKTLILSKPSSSKWLWYEQLITPQHTHFDDLVMIPFTCKACKKKINYHQSQTFFFIK